MSVDHRRKIFAPTRGDTKVNSVHLNQPKPVSKPATMPPNSIGNGPGSYGSGYGGGHGNAYVYGNGAPLMDGATKQNAPGAYGSAYGGYGNGNANSGTSNVNSYGSFAYAPGNQGNPGAASSMLRPRMGSMMGGFGSYGGMNGFGSHGVNSMNWMGGTMLDEGPPVVYKLFSSRRDRPNIASECDFPSRYNSLRMSFSRGSAYNAGNTSMLQPVSSLYGGHGNNQGSTFGDDGMGRAPSLVDIKSGNDGGSTSLETNKRDLNHNNNIGAKSTSIPASGSALASPAGTKGRDTGDGTRNGTVTGSRAGEANIKKSAPVESKERDNKSLGPSDRSAATAANPALEAALKKHDPSQSQTSAAGGAGDTARRIGDSSNSVKGKSSEKERAARAQDVPQAREVNEVHHKPAVVNGVFGGGEKAREQQQEDMEKKKAQDDDEEEEGMRLRSRSTRGSMRRRSSMHRSRSASMVSMTIAEFPEAEEIKDNLTSQVIDSADLSTVRRRSRASLLDGDRPNLQPPPPQQQQQQTGKPQEAASRQAPDASRRRDIREQEDQRQREEQRRLDEETKRRNEEERRQRKEEERRRFEETRRRDTVAEEERLKSLVDRNAEEEQQGKSSDSATVNSGRQRSGSRRPQPMSRRGSSLREIPEQPPDVVASSVKDTMANELASTQEHEHQQQRRRSTVAGEPDIPEVAEQEAASYTGQHNAGAQRAKQRESPTSRNNTVTNTTTTTTTTTNVTHQRVKGETAPVVSRSAPATQEGVKVASSAAQPPGQTQQQQQSKEETTATHQTEQRDKRSNPIKTLVVVEKGVRAGHVSINGNTFAYRGTSYEADEVVSRESNSNAYHSNVFSGIKNYVCDGFNASILSVEAPNTGGVFRSPVWSGLTRVVRGVLQKSHNLPESTMELTVAFGFIHKDKVRDLFDEGNGSFEPLVVHPSPIYGPRIPQLRYGKITSDSSFEDAISSALRRASADPVLSTTSGVAVALLLCKQNRMITDENGEKTCDVFLSSLVVASAGCDTMPFDSAIARMKNEYGTVFHLVLGGPCYTCFVLNLSATEEEAGAQEHIEKLIALHRKMRSFYNYPLRSGSVNRFVSYVETANKEGQERLQQEENPEKRKKLERYIQEQLRLLKDAHRMLKDARAELEVKES